MKRAPTARTGFTRPVLIKKKVTSHPIAYLTILQMTHLSKKKFAPVLIHQAYPMSEEINQPTRMPKNAVPMDPMKEPIK